MDTHGQYGHQHQDNGCMQGDLYKLITSQFSLIALTHS